MRLTDIMSGSGLAFYAEIALILFLIAFVAIAVWIFHPSRKRSLEQDSRIPLDDHETTVPKRGAER
jgi:cbb3-type cytochrome oxidase subunit 3